MMKKLLICLLLIFYCSHRTAAQTPPGALSEARTLYNSGRYDEVIQKMNASPASSRAPREVAYLMGMSWYQKHEYQRAIPYLETVVRAGNEAPEGPVAREYFECMQALGLSHYLLG